jgi:putative addiction module component (TIGR02574 family)
MGTSAKSLGISELPAADRLALISEIWDGLASDHLLPDLTAEQSAELARRVAEDDEFPDEVVDAEVVFANLRSRFALKSRKLFFAPLRSANLKTVPHGTKRKFADLV